MARTHLPSLSGAWSEELVTPLPPAGADMGVEEAGNGSHLFWTEQLKDRTFRFGWDGQASPAFDLIPQQDGSPVVWSPDGSSVGILGQRGDAYLVWVNGREYGPFQGITRSVPPTFSADGRRSVFGYLQDGRMHLMVDGEPYGDWRPAPVRPVFDPTGERLAFVAENMELQSKRVDPAYRQWLVLDGEPGPEGVGIASEAGGITFSPDGRRVAYVLIERPGQVRMVLDGVSGPTVEGIAHPTFSPDGRRLAYFGQSGGKLTLAGDVDGPGDAQAAMGPISFSPDGRRLGYIAVRGKGRMVVVVDGQASGEYADFWAGQAAVEFSPDSHHWACLAQRRSTGFMGLTKGAFTCLVDGVETGSWEEVWSGIHYSSTENRFAFAARQGKRGLIVLDGRSEAPFDAMTPPVYGPSGRLAYVGARGDARMLVVDGEPVHELLDLMKSPRGEMISFSPDGGHVAITMKTADGWRPLVDDRVGPAFDKMSMVRWSADRAEFSAFADDGLLRVSTPLGG